MSHSIEIPADVAAYIDEVPAEHRAVFDRLHELVLETLPDAKVVLSYKMPAYVAPGGRVSLSNGKAGVSIATTVPEPIAESRARRPQFKTGKVTVLFPPGADLPLDDIRGLIRGATSLR